MVVDIEKIEEHLSKFNGREQKLEMIKRYAKRSPMFYRTNNGIHSRRVARITNEIIPFAEHVFGGDFNGPLALAQAYVHDDPEIITGDIEVCTKKMMDLKELVLKRSYELEAIGYFCQLYPERVNGYKYHDLLDAAIEKVTKEAQVVSLADKLDGFGEALHEVFAGNTVFMEGINGVAPPCVNYTKILSEFERNFPLIIKLWDAYYGAHPAFTSPPPIESYNLADARPHTIDSIMKPSGHPQYESWKRVTIDNGWIGLLVTMTEHQKHL
ncbi:hypothetical protein COV19_06900 [Candidatus Woesearchaeota archaeon CG10_big_fil_rev_8_21_14_0_10_44_13]|nr:MAG: hypothetical protein COV19_06900 [Candidatus Woesearchaeota archaeon CG10_big_fil_rev_8_21_14_0_10_44_13]